MPKHNQQQANTAEATNVKRGVSGLHREDLSGVIRVQRQGILRSTQARDKGNDSQSCSLPTHIVLVPVQLRRQQARHEERRGGSALWLSRMRLQFACVARSALTLSRMESPSTPQNKARNNELLVACPWTLVAFRLFLGSSSSLTLRADFTFIVGR